MHIRPLESGDVAPLLDLLRRTAVFEEHEIAIADELLRAALAGSPDYIVHVADDAESRADSAGAARVLGYTCYGHNPITDALYDVYWVAVEPSMQGRGIGQQLLAHVERRVQESGGRGLILDTSSRTEYNAAHRLYARCGFRRVAEVPDFYRRGDSLCMYMKLF